MASSDIDQAIYLSDRFRKLGQMIKDLQFQVDDAEVSGHILKSEDYIWEAYVLNLLPDVMQNELHAEEKRVESQSEKYLPIRNRIHQRAIDNVEVMFPHIKIDKTQRRAFNIFHIVFGYVVLEDHQRQIVDDTYTCRYLMPGAIAKVWPDEFAPIFIEMSPAEELPSSVFELALLVTYVTMKKRKVQEARKAAYAKALFKLADWVRQYATHSSDYLKAPTPNPREIIVALDEEAKILRWGSKSFSGLTPKMIKVLSVFVDDYLKGGFGLSIAAIKTRSGETFDGSFKNQIFKLNRKTGPRLHEVAELVETVSPGVYKLKSPPS